MGETLDSKYFKNCNEEHKLKVPRKTWHQDFTSWDKITYPTSNVSFIILNNNSTFPYLYPFYEIA